MIPIIPAGHARQINEGSGTGSVQTDSPDFTHALEDRFHVSDSMDAAFLEASRAYEIPIPVLKAVAKAESGFNFRAQSHCGAMGVMQLMPATARSLGVTDPWDPRQNIMGGSKYLRSMLNKYDGNLKLALAAYNAGSGNVDKYGGIPPFQETQNYVRKIYGYLKQSEEAYIPPNENVFPPSLPSPPTMEPPLDSSSGLAGRFLGLLSGIAGSQGGSLSDFFDQINNFDDFTEDDYLMLLEMMRLQMNSSLTKSPTYE